MAGMLYLMKYYWDPDSFCLVALVSSRYLAYLDLTGVWKSQEGFIWNAFYGPCLEMACITSAHTP